MTLNEDRVNFSLWALLAAPLLAGNDLVTMPPDVRDILLNRGVIAVDQDALSRQGDRAFQTGPLEVWTKPLADGDVAVGLFNRLRSPTEMTLDLSRIGWHSRRMARNFWTHTDIRALPEKYTVMVPPHSVVMLRFLTLGRERLVISCCEINVFFKETCSQGRLDERREMELPV